MSKRLQVIMDEEEYKRFKKFARSANQPLGAWVRDSLRRITSMQSARSMEEKLKTLDRALSINAPVGEVEEMNRQIVAGYLKDG